MAFVIPKSKADSADGQFRFGPDTGEEFSVPLRQYMTLEQTASLAMFEVGQIRADSLTSTLAGFVGDAAAAYMVKLDMEQIRAIMDAWDEASDVTSGESEPSETSSPSTEGQSGQPA